MKLKCYELADFLGDYVAGELPADVLEAFEWHLARCPSCREYVAQYRQTIIAGRRAFVDAEAPAPDDVPDELVKAILEARRREG